MHPTTTVVILALTAPATSAQDEIKAGGVIEPAADVAVKARVGGYVQSVLVEPGDRISARAKLVDISAPELQAAAHRAAATLLQQEGELEILTVELEIAKKRLSIAEREVRVSSEELPKAKETLDTRQQDLESAKALAKAGQVDSRSVAQARVDLVEARAAWLHAGERVKNAQDEVEIARLMVRRAELEVVQQQRRIDEARAELEMAKIRAGFAEIQNVLPAATVADVLVSPGSLVVAGETPLMRLMVLNRVRVVCDVPMHPLAQLKAGNPVRVTHGNRKVEAEVSRVMPTVDPRTGAGRVEILLDNAEGHWQPGLRVGIVFHPRK